MHVLNHVYELYVFSMHAEIFGQQGYLIMLEPSHGIRVFCLYIHSKGVN